MSSPSKRRRVSMGGIFSPGDGLPVAVPVGLVGPVGRFDGTEFTADPHRCNTEDWKCGMDVEIRPSGLHSNAQTSLWVIKDNPDVLVKAQRGMDKDHFLREMAMAARISEHGISPRLYRWYYSTTDQTGVVIMERFPESLAAYIERTKRIEPWMSEQYAQRLGQLAMSAQITCADLKPDNVVVDEAKRDLRLIDFGDNGCSPGEDGRWEDRLALMLFVARLMGYFKSNVDVFPEHNIVPGEDVTRMMSEATQYQLLQYGKNLGLPIYATGMKLRQLMNQPGTKWSPAEVFAE